MRPHAEFDSNNRLVSTNYDDVYFSGDGIAETEHVFIRGNNLDQRFSQTEGTFVVAETGFGTGLNFLVTANAFVHHAPATAKLVFITTEMHLLQKETLEAAHASLPEHLQERATALRSALDPLPNGASIRIAFDHERISLHILLGDARKSLDVHSFASDAWFLDGFSPKKNPAMWSPELLRAVADHTAPHGTFATYTVAGSVRRGLQDAGFEVERATGFAQKREMLCGHQNPNHPDNQSALLRVGSSPLPNNVHVIGAGFAGASIAHALATRGVNVTVVDPRGTAMGASGIPAAIIRPRLWAEGKVPDAEIIACAFRHTSKWLKDIAGERFRACGTMLCATDEADKQWLQRRSANPATSDIASWLSPEEASKLAGTQIPHGAVWIPNAGVCDLKGLTRDLLDHENISLRRDPPSDPADLCIIATSNDPRTTTNRISTQDVRGQAISCSWPAEFPAPKTVLCTSGYLTPPDNEGVTWIGSTYDRDNEDALASEADDIRIRALFKAIPAIAQPLNQSATEQRFAAIRRTMPDRLPCVGFAPPAKDGLAVVFSIAHGSRGAVTGPWAASLIASAIFREPLNIPPDYWRRLRPSRNQTL
jgi:tRNA 5-methylaminomethyl-2-thiouridine biosynthesis bifunctional protein